MSDTLADLVVNIKANFGDAVAQAEALRNNLKQMGDQAGATGESLKATADSLKALIDGTGLAGGELKIFESVLRADAAAGISLSDSLKTLSESSDSVGKSVADAAATLLENLKPALEGAAGGAEGLGGASGEAVPPMVALGEAAQAVVDKQAALEERAREAAQAVVELQAAFENGSVGAEALALAEENLARATEAAGTAMKEAGGESEEAGDKLEKTGQGAKSASGSIGELYIMAQRLAGVALGIEMLRRSFLNAFGAFATVERATASLTALTKSATGAEYSIAGLKVQALQLGVPFESLLQTFQSMAARFGSEVGKFPRVLAAAADSAAATKGSFESVANTIERMASAGMASGRVLLRLGIDAEILGKAMGVTAAEGAKKFKNELDIGERLEVIVKALGKFEGQARKTTSELEGMWINLKTQMGLQSEEIGRTLAPLAKAFLIWSSQTVKEIGGVITNIIMLGKFIGELPAIVKTALMTITLYLSGHPWSAVTIQVARLVLTLQGYIDVLYATAKVEKAAATERAALLLQQQKLYQDYPEFGNRLGSLTQQLQKGEISWKAYTLALMVLGKEFRALHPYIDETSNKTKKLSESAKAVRDAIAAIVEAEGGAQKAYKASKAAWQELNRSYLENKPMTDGHIATIHEAEEAMKALVKAGAAVHIKIETVDDKKLGKVAGEQVKFRIAVQETIEPLSRFVALQLREEFLWEGQAANLKTAQEALDKTFTEYRRGTGTLEALNAAIKNVDDAWSAVNETMSKGLPGTTLLDPKTLTEMAAGLTSIVPEVEALEPFVMDLALAFQTLGLSIEGGARQKTLNMIEAFRTVAEDGTSSADQVKASWGQLSPMLSKLAKSDLPLVIALEKTYTEALLRRGATQTEILHLQERELQMTIRDKAEKGTAANKEIIQLTNIETRLKAHNTLVNAAGNLYRDMMRTVDQAFTRMGSGIARAIVDFHNFGKNIRAVGIDIATMFLELVVGAIMKMIAALIMTAIFGKASAEALRESYAVTGAVAAGQSVAAIPFWGWTMVAPVTAATYAFLSGFGKIAGALGGLTGGLGGLGGAAAEAGDTGAGFSFALGGFVPEDMIAMVHQGEYVIPAHEVAAASAGGMGSGVEFNNCQFSGVTQELVNDVMNRAVKASRRVGAKW